MFIFHYMIVYFLYDDRHSKNKHSEFDLFKVKIVTFSIEIKMTEYGSEKL